MTQTTAHTTRQIETARQAIAIQERKVREGTATDLTHDALAHNQARLQSLLAR